MRDHLKLRQFVHRATVFCLLGFTAICGAAETLVRDAEGAYREDFETDPTRGLPSTSGQPQRFGNDAAPWRIHADYAYLWDTEVAHGGGHSVRLGPAEGHVMLNSQPLPIQPGEYVEAAVWAKTRGANGETYLSVEFLSEGKSVRETRGGTPQGPIMYLAGSLPGDADWTRLRARTRAPNNADAMIINLITLNNTKGHAWFDDLSVVVHPPEFSAGELDRNPVKIDPQTLKPRDYVTVKGDDLWHKGKRLKIWSAQGNLVAADHAEIDRELARFAQHGFNGHRSLWWDEEISEDYTPGDCTTWDLRDYLIAALGQKSIFFWNDLINSCKIHPEQVSIIDDPATADAWKEAVTDSPGWQLTVIWDPRTKAIYHDYIRRLLAHKNKHNGLTYAEDPTIAIWELTNEQWWIMRMLWGNHLALPAFFQKGLSDQWNAWLRDKYRTPHRLTSAWGSLLEGESLEQGNVLMLPLLGDTKVDALSKTLGLNVTYQKPAYGPADLPKARGNDVVEFLMKLVTDSKNESSKFFKSQGRPGLGNQIVPLVYDTGYSGAVLPLYTHSFADATASGVYLDLATHDPRHKTFPFRSGLTEAPLLHDWIDTRRVAGKPAFVYEIMAFMPQKYKAEFPYRLLAWAAIQDVDVIDFHYYGHPLALADERDRFTMNPLQHVSPTSEWNGASMRMDEVLMSAVKLAGEIFKNDSLEPAPNPTTATLGRKTLWSMDGLHGGPLMLGSQDTVFERGFQWAFNPRQENDTLSGKLVNTLHGRPEVVTPTDQITFRRSDGILVIDDSAAKALVGFVPDSFEFKDRLDVENIHVSTPEGMPFVIRDERYVAFGIAAEDGKSLAASSKVVISAANTNFNSGFEMDLKTMAKDQAYAFGLARSITNQGGLPVLVGRVGMTVTAPWLKGRSYRMIDVNNNVLAEGTLDKGELTIPSDKPVFLTEITNAKSDAASLEMAP